MILTSLRISIFFAILIILLISETFYPRRSNSKRSRKQRNLAIFFLDLILVKFLLSITLIDIAHWGSQNWSLFEFMQAPPVIKILCECLFLDFALYWQHYFFHHNDFLWNIHRLHHMDREMDVTTGVRFHPLEVFASFVFKALIIIILGISPISVIFFEIIISSMNLFTHANISLPEKVSKILRYSFITPETHEVHHSMRGEDLKSNFGFCFAWWDRMFKTYKRAYPTPNTVHLGLFNRRDRAFPEVLLNSLRKQED